MNLLPIRDIHLPPAIGWWPPPIGWWLLPLLVGALILTAVWLFRRGRRRGSVRRLALQELTAIQQDPGLTGSAKVRRISILLRRVALSVYPRGDTAPLNGKAWLEWLDRPLGDGRFVDGPGRALDDGPYRPEFSDSGELEALLALCRDWLEKLPVRQ
jgi:hypothetical protein